MLPGFVLDLAQLDPDDNRPWDFNDPEKAGKAKQLIKAKLQKAKAKLDQGAAEEENWEDAEENEDDEMLCDNIDQMKDELKKIDEQVEDVEVDIINITLVVTSWFSSALPHRRGQVEIPTYPVCCKLLFSNSAFPGK